MLKIDNVSKSFSNVLAVKNLSFEVKRGEVVGVVGQNGAGKSTTFKMILNFLSPDAGEITINSKKLKNDFLDNIGYLPEERGLYLDMTIKQQVLYFAQLHNYSKTKASKELSYWLERLAVKGTERTLIKNLSKGNQQKVQLITTLIHKPKIVILDEPFSGLDPVNISLLIKIVKQLKKEGTAVIFSSHNMNNVTEVSDKILMLVNGEQKLYGPVNQVRSKFEKNKVYLEGIFNTLSPSNFSGILNQKDDFPGKVLTFNSEENARKAIKKAKAEPSLTGYRLLEPTLDDIFRRIIKEEAMKNA
ncbi:ATP-binding cassette domain-containing protein [Limosilactobacillus sp. STM2_1]|uniref:ATP-binding cassette domain-containing protein n=1 Tax=Limosilactobacillus rudii TaxID=2759755 RepID=A0A7W3ULD0_9LACO|nr:ATP-binding cassette domain-containing protein [Limosilactobacillus rudii]MBB1079643.1 ATP-binding cassette domain-containing protein [Limosilactobacillus rudii]MBB1097721.1 ATP-binding cassette domain-containing protein [Limosilactobacillus rudii]MCD7134367.1 ATP-binding cassette domain-containing protein [Limosilactobacillus rudii]